MTLIYRTDKFPSGYMTKVDADFSLTGSIDDLIHYKNELESRGAVDVNYEIGIYEYYDQTYPYFSIYYFRESTLEEIENYTCGKTKREKKDGKRKQ